LKLHPARLKKIFSDFQDQKVVVLGDLMLDEYIWGRVKRISPEAPVPVVEVQTESLRLGGAANVALNLLAMGARPLLVGLVGRDRTGQRLISEAGRHGLVTRGILAETGRHTTIKTRVIAHHQHVVRIDKEATHHLEEKTAAKLVSILEKALDGASALLFEDYNKGVLTPKVINLAIGLAKAQGALVTVDPKFDNFFSYKGATVFKPNQQETEQALGIRITNEKTLLAAGRTLQDRFPGSAILITRGEHGLALFEKKTVTHIPTVAREVYDVSGAGDTTIAALTLCLASGATLGEAAHIANQAAGIEVGKVGIAPVSKQELWDALTAPEKK
jgi:D-glycero-beta-D-manno-heptose-7-phosphate kinase